MRKSWLVLLLGFHSSLFAASTPASAPERLTYLDFWASWCTPCAKSFPWLNEMKARYGDRIEFVGVNVDTDRKLADRFLKKHPAQFALRYDPEGALAKQYRLTGMPSAILLNAKGEVVHRHDGFRDKDKAIYEAELRRALGLK